jgi:diguanylate cyclase
VAGYREEIEGLAEQAGDVSRVADPNRAAAVMQLMSQIVSANQRLQRRLNDAETSLQHQTEELEDYLSEARTDSLTDLPNRRALDEELVRRLAEWRRYDIVFSVALLDIDNLNEINERFGRIVGDRILQEVARSIRACMRDADLVARFGGEEFAIIMPATCEPASFRAMERARESVEEIVIELDGEEIRPTVSCGATQAHEDDDTAAVLQRADAALYTSKCAGRNQSHWHDGHRCLPIAKSPPAEPAAEAAECTDECATV